MSPLCKQLLLSLYYHASYPVRAWDRWRDAAEDRVPVLVVYYHRIADDRANPWTISNAMFARQIGWLRNRFSLVSLEETQLRIARGCNCEPCVSITFDDGYADNCQQAIPLLIKERIPCTYFVTVRNVLAGAAFEHDLAQGQWLRAEHAGTTSGHGRGRHRDRRTQLHARRPGAGSPIPRWLADEIVTAKQRLEQVVGPAGALLRLSLREAREPQSPRRSRWRKRPATPACAPPTAASTFPATTRSTCNASPWTTT